MKVLKWAVVLLMAVLGLMAGASALASAAPATQGDVTYLQLLNQNGVSYPNPEAMVSYAHDLVDQLSASPQNDASVGSIVSTGEERISQHDMGVIIAAAVVATDRPRSRWFGTGRTAPLASPVVPQLRGCCDEQTDHSCVGGLRQHRAVLIHGPSAPSPCSMICCGRQGLLRKCCQTASETRISETNF